MPNIINEIKLDYNDVLIRPRSSTLNSRAEVDLFTEMKFRNSKRTFKGIPIMASNMANVGTFEMAKALSKHRMFTAIDKYYTVEEWETFAASNPECLDYVAVSSGTGDAEFYQLSSILSSIPQISFICFHIANGYSQHYADCIAGNVATTEMVEELVHCGADIIKIGIGPGSGCLTRAKTGVGYPQLSAVIECAAAAHALDAHIIADGGCTCVGDLAKALGAGADFVMVGGMFAGHDQGGGEIIERDGKRYSLFYGLSSITSMEKHYGGVADYRASEGRTVEIPYKGDVEITILDILGGLRSACTYVGAPRLQEFSQLVTFVRCTQQLNNVFVGPASVQSNRSNR